MPQHSTHNLIGIPFLELQSVDSTNTYARGLIHTNMAQHGMVIFAHEQLAGKGQRGKTWLTEKDANIILSVLIDPVPVPLSQQFQLSACMIVAVHDFFSKYAGDETKIKWPNDLYWRDRKAGGVLIESVVRSRKSEVGSQTSDINLWQWAIVGIGINVNQKKFSSELPNPVSLNQITGKNFDVINLAKELCEILDKKFNQLISDGFENIFSEYNDYLYKKNEKVKLKKENRVFEAIIKSVSPAGQLVVQHSIEEKFDLGEIEWLL